MLKYKVDGWNNFCRVFELPNEYPKDFCFGGGIPVMFKMVDWFNPVEEVTIAGVTKEVWRKKVGEIEGIEIDLESLENKVIPFLQDKTYVREFYKYLIIFDFGASTIFEKDKND